MLPAADDGAYGRIFVAAPYRRYTPDQQRVRETHRKGPVMKADRLSARVSTTKRRGLWCPLRKIYFPQVFAFISAHSDDTEAPIHRLYTLNPEATPRSNDTRIVPINCIDPSVPEGGRRKSLVVRHHETLEMGIGYANGIEDLTNTCDFVELYVHRTGVFTLLLRPTARKWPSPMIFYIAEARHEDTQRFEVAVGSNGRARAVDFLGTD